MNTILIIKVYYVVFYVYYQIIDGITNNIVYNHIICI